MAQAPAHPGVGRILAKWRQRFGVSVAQLSLLVNTNRLAPGGGAVSWLTYADRLMEFSTAMLGVAWGGVAAPVVAKLRRRGRRAFSDLLDWGLRLVLLLALPAAVVCWCLPSLWWRCFITMAALRPTTCSKPCWPCRAMAGHLMGLIGVKVLAPGFYATQDIKTPVRIGITVLAITQGFNVILCPCWGTPVLALSIGLGSLVNVTGCCWGSG